MSQQEQILIVEDDEAIATGLALNLRLEGYESTVVGDGVSALEHIATEAPDLILLDISLPRKNGLDVLRETRASGNDVPIIILSARQDEFDKVSALRLGADDYVTKPFGLAELLARVVAVLRRASRMAGGSDSDDEASAASEPGSRFRFASTVVDVRTRTVARGSDSVSLTHLEFELLTFFLQHPEKVFSREELLRRVWGLSHGGSRRTVDNFVAQLRGKLEADPGEPVHLVTVRGSGYRFDP